MSCTLLTWASVTSPKSLLLSPLIAGLQRDLSWKNFIILCFIWCFKHLLYSHWQHTITAFHSVDNLAVHFGHISSARTPQPVWRTSWMSCPIFAINFWESMLLGRRGGLRHPPRKMTCWLTDLCSQNVHDKIKVITVRKSLWPSMEPCGSACFTEPHFYLQCEFRERMCAPWFPPLWYNSEHRPLCLSNSTVTISSQKCLTRSQTKALQSVSLLRVHKISCMQLYRNCNLC